ncbi:hypothetical protein A1O3_05370 [Capronia epimyces CBS 606.96]|uniref:N-acetyltransferase domain-containing protein n=1 Tax=Capronia epimyces CBS 606.96 TaxID=1182542 RepID=W9Y4X1_9EURO|nr:uncharacterized protein A1O3_05370 [Capronia epimyces CBS 606.96]EXJ84700.1 hypothetical protein A1O3_05370 [Capronia epimyces CBS 606.96]
MASLSVGAHGPQEMIPSVPSALEPRSLPPAQSPDLKLVPATPAENIQTAYLNQPEWGGPLTLEQYLEREAILKSTDLSREGRLVGWILTSDSLPTNDDGTRHIFASCETFTIHGYVAQYGIIERVQAHAIASVYTRPEYRGKGYAGRLMAELGERLETWRQSSLQKANRIANPFSVLWSDIGRDFYAKHGWKAFPSNHIHLAPLNLSGYEAIHGLLPVVDDLFMADVPQIPAVDTLEERLLRLSESNRDITYVAIRPDLEHLQWHFAREEYIHQALGRPRPWIKGAIHRETGIALIWCRVYPESGTDRRLCILHTVVHPSVENSETAQAAMTALLLRAQLEAQFWEMGAVEVWDPSDLVIAAAQELRTEEQGKVEIVAREDHLCSLRWTTSSGNDITWLANEKYAWC